MIENSDIIPGEVSSLVPTENVPANGTLEDLLSKYLNDFTIEDDTVIGYINESEKIKEIIDKMKIQGFAYSVRDSDVREKQRTKVRKNLQAKSNGKGRKRDVLPNLTVFFQLRAMPIKFFGLPFTIEKTTHYQCAYGCKYYKSKAGDTIKKIPDESGELKPVKKLKKVGSKKMGCLAKMTIKHITVYPQYQLYLESDWRKKKMVIYSCLPHYMSLDWLERTGNLYHCRRVMDFYAGDKLIENLRRDLLDVGKTVERFERYYLSISVQSSHNHPPIIIVPRQRMEKRKLSKLIPKVNKAPPKKKPKTDEPGSKVCIVENEGEWACKELQMPDLNAVQEVEVKGSVSLEQLENPNVYHTTIVKIPTPQPVEYELIEDKSDKIEIQMTPYDPNENAQTIEVYEYQPTIQDLQSLFKEKLKRLYTLSTSCSNGSLLLRLAIELEQIETQLSTDLGFPTL